MKTTPIDTASTIRKPASKVEMEAAGKIPVKTGAVVADIATSLDDTKITIDHATASIIRMLAEEVVAAEHSLEQLKERLQSTLLNNNIKSYRTPSGTAWLRSGTKEAIKVPLLVSAGVDYETIGRAAWGVNRKELVEAGVDEEVITAATTSTPWVSAGVTDYSKKKDGGAGGAGGEDTGE